MANLDKKTLTDLAVPLAKDILSILATKATLSVLDKFERNISRQGAVRSGKGFTLFISNKDMYDIKIVESPEKSDLLIDSATETVKPDIKKRKVGFLGAMTAPVTASLIATVVSSLIQPVVSSLINRQEGEFLLLLDGAYVIKSDDKQVMEHIGFHYLLTEAQLCILILLG